MNLRRLMSLLTLLSLAVVAYPCVCDCAWVVRSSIYICYVPGSVSPSASASSLSVLVSSLLAPPLLCL